MNNYLTAQERQAMRQRYATPKVAAKDRLFKVKLCGMVVYGPATYGLCDYYINLHHLNCKPTEVK